MSTSLARVYFSQTILKLDLHRKKREKRHNFNSKSKSTRETLWSIGWRKGLFVIFLVFCTDRTEFQHYRSTRNYQLDVPYEKPWERASVWENVVREIVFSNFEEGVIFFKINEKGKLSKNIPKKGNSKI